jgi:peptidyl-tRNA hydrolase
MFTHRIVHVTNEKSSTVEFATSFENAVVRAATLNSIDATGMWGYRMYHLLHHRNSPNPYDFRIEVISREPEPIFETPVDEPYFYTVVRNDTDSLSRHSGKIAAQVGHAATKMILDGFAPKKLISKWAGDRGFGVKIVLSASPEDMYQAVELAGEVNVAAGIVYDPSFPVHDGSVLHLIPLDTCAYFFGMKSDTRKILSNFPLMKQPK